jgi:hypothetical protein
MHKRKRIQSLQWTRKLPLVNSALIIPADSHLVLTTVHYRQHNRLHKTYNNGLLTCYSETIKKAWLLILHCKHCISFCSLLESSNNVERVKPFNLQILLWLASKTTHYNKMFINEFISATQLFHT